MPSLVDQLGHWRPFTALVVGDFMLDQMVFGDADRLSPDAPVPVLSVRHTEERPGGAANVCLDLAALRGRVIAFGARGDDPEGRSLETALERAGVDLRGLIADADRPTTVKRSLVGLAQHRHAQKMFRLDMESRKPLGAEIRERLLQRFEQTLPEADIVCLEDYDKGVCDERMCAEIIRLSREAGKPVLVDPAAIEDFRKYRGATALTPNRTEAEAAAAPLGADVAEAESLASALRQSLDLDAIVVTLDRDGAMLCEAGQAPQQLPTIVREVYDVTGAGDMVLAALAAARSNGLDWREAVRLANVAAGLEVEVFGVQPIPLEDIRHSLMLQEGALRGKLRTLEEALVEIAAHRRKGRTIVFTNGCFDVLHAGHIWLLRQAAKFGDFLVVAMNDDDSVRRLKGADRPVNHQDDRVEILSELESVGAVVLFSTDTPVDLIEAIQPDVLVKGADYERSEVVGADIVEAAGGRVELVDLLEGRSTSLAIERMRNG